MASADVFNRWRAAHREAVAAARAMADKSLRALDGRGEPPTAAEAAEVRRLRRTANEQFDAVMARLGAAGSLAGARCARGGR